MSKGLFRCYLCKPYGYSRQSTGRSASRIVREIACHVHTWRKIAHYCVLWKGLVAFNSLCLEAIKRPRIIV